MARDAFFNTFKIGNIATDAVDTQLQQYFHGLREGAYDVADDHVGSDLERLIIALWH
jgi:hypothetical protein